MSGFNPENQSGFFHEVFKISMGFNPEKHPEFFRGGLFRGLEAPTLRMQFLGGRKNEKFAI
jgi:hypothetical protein